MRSSGSEGLASVTRLLGAPDARAGTSAPDKHRVLFVSHTCYFDASNGANIASRSMMECLARQGFAAAAVTGMVLESGCDIDPGSWLAEQELTCEADRRPPVCDGEIGAPGSAAGTAHGYRLNVRNVAVVLDSRTTLRQREPEEAEIAGFLQLLDETFDRFLPEVMVTFGGDDLATRIRRLARSRGIAVVFALHNLNYGTRSAFTDTDAVTVPSRFAASYYRTTLGLEAAVLPNLVDFQRALAATRDPRYVTFVNPSHEKGVFAFARIADELGRRRPDIPLLVVEGRGTERTLVDCGLDLRSRGNVSVMSHTADPRHFWGATRIALMPSLCWESQGLVAVEAMINGIPVIASDRGALPETLGDAGIILGLPPRLTPLTLDLPTAAEVEPWVRAIIGLWDDADWYAEACRRSRSEAARWDPALLEPLYADFFAAVAIRDDQPHLRPLPEIEGDFVIDE